MYAYRIAGLSSRILYWLRALLLLCWFSHIKLAGLLCTVVSHRLPFGQVLQGRAATCSQKFQRQNVDEKWRRCRRWRWR
jgi:hypothetical protein